MQHSAVTDTSVTQYLIAGHDCPPIGWGWQNSLLVVYDNIVDTGLRHQPHSQRERHDQLGMHRGLGK